MSIRAILSVEGVRFPLTGTGRYAFELARHLPAAPNLAELRLFGTTGFCDKADGTSARQGARIVRPVMAAAKRFAPLASLAATCADQLAGRRLARCGTHVFHGTRFALPAHPGPSVVTIHDLTVYTMPECHPPERVRHLRGRIEDAVRRADHVIAVSKAVRDEIIARFGLEAERVHAIALAPSPVFRPRSAGETAATLDRLGLSHRGFTLFAGTIEPRKNLIRLIAAYETLPQALRQRFPLVIAGHPGWRHEAIMRAIAKAERGGWLMRTGYLDENALADLFAAARLFALPSLAEGFGLPIVEAMASATPVLTSSVTAMPETAGGAAILVDPHDVIALGEALNAVLDDETRQERMRGAGLGHAKSFSWAKTAAETCAVYGLAAARFDASVV